MLEIPEAQTIARQLNENVAGRHIVSVIAAQNPHGFAWYFGEPAAYGELLTGLKIEKAEAVGGFVTLAAQQACLYFNDGVNIRLLAPDGKIPPKHQLLLGLDDGSSLVCTVQMYGGIIACPKGLYNNSYFTTALSKPGPLAEEFTLPYFRSIAAQAEPKLSIKGLLATEQRIPGLGNGCLQDILYLAGVNPQSRIGAISPAKQEELYHSIISTLRLMAEKGGRDTEKDLFGKTGGYKTRLSSKTLAYACPRCGSGIQRKAFLGGNVYFCPLCQPVEK